MTKLSTVIWICKFSFSKYSSSLRPFLVFRECPFFCTVNWICKLSQQNPRNEMDKQEEEEQMWLDDEMDGMYVKLLLFK